MTFAPTCFGSHRNHPQGAVQYLNKSISYGSTVLVGMDVVNAMAACDPVCLCAMCTDHGAGTYCFLPSTGQLPEDGSCVNRNMSERML
jgi:hypothetical protein